VNSLNYQAQKFNKRFLINMRKLGSKKSDIVFITCHGLTQEELDSLHATIESEMKATQTSFHFVLSNYSFLIKKLSLEKNKLYFFSAPQLSRKELADLKKVINNFGIKKAVFVNSRVGVKNVGK
jgi:hypothetical protein